MAYEPLEWTNREVERPRTFTVQNNPDGTVTLIPAEGQVTEPGTPIMAVNMNRIEQGIADLDADSNDATKHVKYGIDTGTGNLKTVQVDGVTEYVDGLAIAFKVNATYTGGTAAINVNGLGNKTVKRPNGTNFPASQLHKDGIYTFRFNASTNSFIVQGEGGEYGDATAAQVLAGKTFGTENGLATGTMADKSNGTFIGSRVSSGNTFVDIAPMAGFYSGGAASRARVTDSSFLPTNIKKGVAIFGVAGTLGEKYATGQAYSTTGGAEFININNLGFKPRVVIAKVANVANRDRYAAVYMFSPAVYGDLDFRIADNGTVYTNGSSYVNNNLFKLQVDSINSRLYNWMAFGSEDYN